MTYCHYKHLFRMISFIFLTSFTSSRAWIPNVILFESKNISLTFELQGSLGIPRPVPSVLKFLPLGAGLGIPCEPRSSKVRLKVLLSNRMTSGIHALSLAIISWNFNSLSIRRMLQKKVFSLGRKNKRHHLWSLAQRRVSGSWVIQATYWKIFH